MSVFVFLGLLLLCAGFSFAFIIESVEESLSGIDSEFCIAQSGVDKEILNECMESPNPCPDDPKLKCFLKCTFAEMLGILGEDGEINVDALVAMVPKDYVDMAEPIIRECGTVKGEDDCDTAYLTFSCWVSKGQLSMESELIIDYPNSDESDSEYEASDSEEIDFELCITESGVDKEIIDMCIESPNACPKDPKLKCFLKCLMTTYLPIMREDGEIDVEAAVAIIPEVNVEMAAPIIRGCGTVKGVDDCDTAYLTVSCWLSNGPLFMESITSLYEDLVDRSS